MNKRALYILSNYRKIKHSYQKNKIPELKDYLETIESWVGGLKQDNFNFSELNNCEALNALYYWILYFGFLYGSENVSDKDVIKLLKKNLSVSIRKTEFSKLKDKALLFFEEKCLAKNERGNIYE